MSLSSVVSGSSNASFHQGDNHGRDLVPPMPPPDIRREPPSNFCFDRPPPSMNINQPPPPVKPDNMSSQPTQIRYPKEALNRSENSISKVWSKSVSESSFNFAGPVGKQVCSHDKRKFLYS